MIIAESLEAMSMSKKEGRGEEKRMRKISPLVKDSKRRGNSGIKNFSLGPFQT